MATLRHSWRLAHALVGTEALGSIILGHRLKGWFTQKFYSIQHLLITMLFQIVSFFEYTFVECKGNLS